MPAGANLYEAPSRATLQRWLVRAVERQLVRCEATGRRNAPYLYWLAEG
jgi:hypothetical protein